MSIPQSLLPPEGLAAFELAGGEHGELKLVEVEGQPFALAMQLRTRIDPSQAKSSAEWSARARMFPAVRLHESQLVIASWWMRCVEPEGGIGITRLVLEEHAAPYDKSAWCMVHAGSEWQYFDLPFRMVADLEPGAYRLEFWMGFDSQVVEIGGLRVLGYDRDTSLDDLSPEVSYVGRSDSAAWREEAQERIERYRKSELKVQILNSVGQPVPDVPVRVRMQRHAFWFGSAVNSERLFGRLPEDETYRSTFLSLFNAATPENELKWIGWEENRARARDTVGWLRRHGIERIRGHNLIWSDSNVPSDIRGPGIMRETIQRRMYEHIRDIVKYFRGEIAEWEVLSESFYGSELLNTLDRRDWAGLFAVARACDPRAELSLNETWIVSHDNVPRQDRYYRLIKDLADHGAPIDAIGMEAHFDYQLTPPSQAWKILDKFAILGKKIRITEFDVNVMEEGLQADYLRDFLTAAFAHPSVDAFSLWGFWAGRMWKPNGALFRDDWTIKPAGEIYQQLVFRDWWTDESLLTNRDGEIVVKGFLGDYQVEASVHGFKADALVTLVAGGSCIVLRLADSASRRN